MNITLTGWEIFILFLIWLIIMTSSTKRTARARASAEGVAITAHLCDFALECVRRHRGRRAAR